MEKSKNGISNLSATEQRIAEICAMPKRKFDEKWTEERKFLREVFARQKEVLPKAEYAEKKKIIQECLKGSPVRKKQLLQFCGRLMERADGKPSDNVPIRPTEDFLGYGVPTETMCVSYSKIPSKKKTDLSFLCKPQNSDDLQALVNEAMRLKKSSIRQKSYADVLDKLIEKRKEINPQFSNATVYRSVGLSKSVYDRAKSNCDTSKHHAWHIIVGLQCNQEEAAEVMQSLGYVINLAIPFDAVMVLMIRTKRYNIYDVNEVLASVGEEIFSVGAVVKDGDSGAEVPRRGRPPKVRDPKKK